MWLLAGVELGRTMLCFILLFSTLLCFASLLLCLVALLCFTLNVNTLAAEREGLGAN